ncbi:GatB/YqeY domain-containing protein [Patescibacteria group bacterium]|mgnify:CR=1 FL=1|nr:GatB/YqeY domain-containing protein [Patescibacteria group bacterium]
MLLDDIRSQVTTAMKAHDAVTVDTLRFLLAAVRNVAIAKYGADGEAKITDADVLDVIKKQVKTHTESVDAFTKANRPELAKNEQAQLAILEQYIPKQLSDEELTALIAPVAAAGGDFGPLMGRAMAAVKGQADGSRVSAILKQLLSSK